MGKKKADEMLFWTKDEFQTFIESMKDRPASYTVFMTMYYTGIREGELLALTPSDIDFEKKTLTVCCLRTITRTILGRSVMYILKMQLTLQQKVKKTHSCLNLTTMTEKISLLKMQHG